MPLTIDSRAVLRAIADHPDAFPAIQPDLDEIARKLIGKQLKAKSTDAALFKALHGAAGAETMATILDSLSGSELAALVKKVDPHGSPARAGEDSGAVRKHLIALATGRVEPAAKPEKPAKAKAEKPAKAPAKAPASKIGTVLGSKVHSGKARASRAKPAA